MNKNSDQNSERKMRIDDIRNIELKETAVLAREILLSFVDVYRWIIPIFDKANVYRIPIKYYEKFRDKDKEYFHHEMYRLKKAKFIRKYFDGKEYFLELTNKGKKQIKQYLTEDLEIKKPVKWDKKWRLVIYDIADDKKDRREILREKLERLGFIKLQESVYVFPFDCLNEINLLKKMYFLDKNVQYIVAERIESEIDLLSKFYDQETLNKKMM